MGTIACQKEPLLCTALSTKKSSMGLMFNSHKYSGDLNKAGLQDKPKLRDSWEEYQDDRKPPCKMTENVGWL